MMRIFFGLRICLGLAIASTTFAVFAATPVKTLVWEDLTPKFSTALADPLAGHELYRRLEIETIIWARKLSERERISEEFRDDVADAEYYVEQMRRQGIDPDRLVREYKLFRRKSDERDRQVVKSLDGEQIKLAGYLLPLEYSDEGVKEFLLVPYVGACIHSPPPPPNQIVFIELDRPFKIEGLYAPVWVTGTMRTKISEKALNYVDGSADIPVGYTLEAELIESYEG